MNGLIHYRYVDPKFYSDILDGLSKRQVLDKIICPYSNDTYSDTIYEKSGIKYIPYGGSFVETYDVNKLIPLPRDFYEKFSKHENIALNMLVRHTYADAYTYGQARNMIILYVRYWYHFFITEKIDFFFSRYIGQYMEEYVIYAVADILNIPTVVFYGEKWGWGLNGMGAGIEKKYNELIHSDIDYFNLSEKDEDYYRKHRGGASHSTSINSIIEKDEINRCIKIAKDTFSLRKIIGSYIYSLRMRRIGKSTDNKELLIYSRMKIYENTGVWIRTIWGYLNRVSQGKYNKISELPDYRKKYIYCALQTVPEIALTPLVGYFDNQIHEIAMLSYCARQYNIEIYVKEHIYQHWREKFFYDEILRFDNVHLIKTTVNTYELIDNSIATSTYTGSCALEGLLRNKPALIFSRNEWRGLPGSYYITSEKSLNDALQSIIEGEWSITDRELRAYLKAKEEAGIFANRGEGIIYPDDTPEEFKKDVIYNVDFIEERINEAKEICRC